MNEAKIIVGGCLEELRKLPDGAARCIVTSPPYWGLRDYGVEGQFGLEASPDEYVEKMVEVFRDVRRVLADDGTLWLNLGDTFFNCDKWGGGGANTGLHTRRIDGSVESWKAVRRRWSQVEGLKPKDLVGIPWRVAFALQADGWYLRSDIIWHKPNAMPESVTDRPTKAHEYLFLISKSARYFYDADAIAERSGGHNGSSFTSAYDLETKPGIGKGPREEKDARNKRSVWTIATKPYADAHFATFPPDLVEPCILAGSEVGDTVLDPFAGAGTAGLVAVRLGRNFLGIELNPEYAELAERRIFDDAPLFNVVSKE